MSGVRLGIILCFALLIPLTITATMYGQAPPPPAAPAAAPEAAAPAAPAAAPTEVQAPRKITLIQMIKWGGPVGYVIILLSIATVALVFKHAFALRREVLIPSRAVEHLEQLISQKKIKEAIDFCKTDESPLCKMMGAGLGELRHGYEDAISIMQEVGEEEVLKHNTGISIFGMFANVGPMLGLLGTVTGMVRTFNEIATALGAVKPAQLAAGIQEALITTVLGLIVAIPNVFAFTMLKNRVTRMFLQLGVVTEELMSPLKGLRVVTAPAPGAPAPGAAPLPSAARAAGVPPVAGTPPSAPAPPRPPQA